MKPANCAPPTVPFIWFVNVFIATTPARTHTKISSFEIANFFKIDGEKWSRNKPAFLADFLALVTT